MLLPLCFRRRILPINSGDVKRLCRGCVHLTIIDRIMAVLLILISAQPSEVSSDESLVTLSRILLRMSLRRQVPETVLSVSVQEFRLSHTSGGPEAGCYSFQYGSYRNNRPLFLTQENMPCAVRISNDFDTI